MAPDRSICHLSYRRLVDCARAWGVVPTSVIIATPIDQRMLGDIVRRVFDGSAKEVVLSLFGQAEIADEELKELRGLINRKLKG